MNGGDSGLEDLDERVESRLTRDELVGTLDTYDRQPGDPWFLNLDEVRLLHRHALSEHGGLDGERDARMLLAAVMQAQLTFDGAWLHPRLCDMAAAYAFHIAQNQPFLDGNKRTALRAALVFLARNGVAVRDPQQKLLGAMLGLADRSVTKTDLAVILEELSLERPG